MFIKVLIEGRMYGRGVFVSVNGFGENTVRLLFLGKVVKTILVDGEDLVLVLEGSFAFAEMIDAKVKATQNNGFIYIHPLPGKAKTGF